MLGYSSRWKTWGSPECHSKTDGDKPADTLKKEMLYMVQGANKVIFIFCPLEHGEENVFLHWQYEHIIAHYCIKISTKSVFSDFGDTSTTACLAFPKIPA